MICSPEKKAQFLLSFADSANVTLSAREIGVSRQTIYNWQEEDPEFAKLFENAKEEGLDLLEKEMQRRGFEGTERTFYDKDGGVRSVVTEYSDTLAIFFMKGNRPDKYKDRVEQENKGEVRITIRDLRLEKEAE